MNYSSFCIGFIFGTQRLGPKNFDPPVITSNKLYFLFYRRIFNVNSVPVMPEDEKHNLLENIEVEAEEEEKKP